MPAFSFRSRVAMWMLTVGASAGLSLACGGEDRDDGGSSGGAGAGGKAGAGAGGKAGAAGSGSAGKAGGMTAGSSAGGAAGAGGSAGSPASAGSSGNGGSSGGGDCVTRTPVASCSEPGTNPDVESSACIELYTEGFAQLICGPREVRNEGCPRNDQLRYICVAPINSDFWYSEDSDPDYWSNNEGGCEINGGSWCPL